MADRSGIFAGDDPFEIARQWLSQAEKTEQNDANAGALATVDADGMPNVRIVLLKDIEDDGLVFFTNYNSRKGQELISAGSAAFNMHWKSLGRQIRVRGSVAKVSATVSDEYYQTRALGSRIGAWASQQSAPLISKSQLVKTVALATAKHGTNPQRPEFWGGFKIMPIEFEFWANGEFRLHDRFRWSRENLKEIWNIQRLNP
ncbi:MAG: pyridoxamine 5'-phosphate oxidase [Paracoccaceae bacterium]